MNFERTMFVKSTLPKQVGLYITFVWSVISYEVVKMYPPMRQRYLWVLKTSCDLHPELFNGGN